MGELLAVRSAAPLWAAAMEYLYSCGDEPVPAPTDSEALAAFDVDPVTGLLPRPGGPTIREWFLAGTQPTESAAAWYDKSNRLLLPDEYTAWCQSPHNRLGARVRESGTLAILAPADNARFEWNPALSPKRQSLAAEANRKDCEWFLNGHPLPDNMVPLTKGRHQLQARQGDEMAEVSILVE
jgi:membrane carboxypeptidase/penicillin-binding protein PbpC